MTEQTRNLLISLVSHMAYMQGQLEARHELDDPEDFYWYRESVALRQKVTDALADEPAVPEGREPASVVGEPSNRMPTLNVIMQLADNYFTFRGNSHGDYFFATSIEANKDPAQSIYEFARAVLARWGTPNQAEIRSSLGNAPATAPAVEVEG